MCQLLRAKQIEIVNVIFQDVNTDGETKCFFINGPGGTGKTFIYKTLNYMLTGKRCKVKCMAFTGIASMLLPNGRTTHKTFGLKIPLTPDSVSSIKPNSSKARKLEEIDIFLMNETPMLQNYGFQTLINLCDLLEMRIFLSVKRCFLRSFYKEEENMRVDTEQREYAKYLLKLGSGELSLNTMEEIELPENIVSTNDLIDEVFGNCK